MDIRVPLHPAEPHYAIWTGHLISETSRMTSLSLNHLEACDRRKELYAWKPPPAGQLVRDPAPHQMVPLANFIDRLGSSTARFQSIPGFSKCSGLL